MPIFLFPGQGSQKAGILKQFAEASTAARAMSERVLNLMPASVARVLEEGAQEELNDTRYAQPSLLCAALVVTAHLDALGIRPDACAGHSVGEVAAFTVAGALSVEQSIPFILERARLMSENVPEGGMAAVIGMPVETIETLLCDGAQIANYNGPSQTIISGASAPLEASVNAIKAHGARRVMALQVSGPFHSQCMTSASEKLTKYLDAMTIMAPKISVFSSVTGAYETDPAQIRALLAGQLRSPVRWTTVMEAFSERDAIEVGPGNALAGLARRADRAPAVRPANTPDACQALLT